MAKQINLSDFFCELFGFEEDPDEPESVFKFLTCNVTESGDRTLHSSVNNKTYNCGQFTLPTLRDLPDTCARPGHKGVLNIIAGCGVQSDNLREIDVGAIQAHPDNAGATFQVASGFNCLEFMRPTQTPQQGITKYIHDRTQGPAASISAAPGTVFRNYFVDVGAPTETPRGQFDCQLNLLGALTGPGKPLPKLNGGYLYFKEDSYATFESEQLPSFDEDALQPLVTVGNHTNVQVTSGLKAATIELCEGPSQTISQVFCSSMDLQRTPIALRTNPNVERVAQFVLKCMYKLTIRAAIANAKSVTAQGKPGQFKLFLTMVGGGVFGNKVEWIVDAILDAGIEESGLDVFLVLFDRRILPAADETMQKLVGPTGGQVRYVK